MTGRMLNTPPSRWLSRRSASTRGYARTCPAAGRNPRSTPLTGGPGFPFAAATGRGSRPLRARDALAPVRAEHNDVDAIWYFGAAEDAAKIEAASVSNLKRTWCPSPPRDWLDPRSASGEVFLRHATQIKNIWVPYGA